MTNLARNVTRGLLVCVAAVGGCTAPAGLDGDRESNIDDRPTAFAWSAVGAGTYNSCAIGQDGQRYCWGLALVADCTPAMCPNIVRPTKVAGTNVSFDSVTSGGGIHCGIVMTGEAYCWGDADASGVGSLGDGTTKHSGAPIRVAIPNQIKAISAGYGHVCALDVQDEAYCWGSNLGGSLGVDVSSNVSPNPRRVSTSQKFRAISAGNTQTCAIANDNTGYCWGSGYGSLGAGARDTACGMFPSCLISKMPASIDGDLRWAMISAGNTFTCGVSLDNKGYCWGAVMNIRDPNPPLGTLGTGTFLGSKVPVLVAGDLKFKSIMAGTRQACALTLTGEAYCWGNNTFAELGIGTTGGRFATPQRVAGNLRFLSLSLADHSCGITVNRNLYCWGSTASGRLGNGQSSPGTIGKPTRVLPPAG